MYVLRYGILTPDEVCGALMSDCGTSIDPTKMFWNLTIPENKPPVQPWPSVPVGSISPEEAFRMMPQKFASCICLIFIWTDGTPKAPKRLALARKRFVVATTTTPLPKIVRKIRLAMLNFKGVNKPARKWGERRCDIPFVLVDNTMKHIASTEKVSSCCHSTIFVLS